MKLRVIAAVVLLPLLWFYSFFDCLNVSALPQAKLDELPDELGFGNPDIKALKAKLPSGSGGKALGWAFILVGGYMLYEMLSYRFVNLLMHIFPEFDLWWLHDLFNEIPETAVAVIIIVLGIRLIRGGKKRADDVPRYQGGREDSAASIMELIRARAEEQPLNDMEESLPENDTEEETPAAESAKAPSEEA